MTRAKKIGERLVRDVFEEASGGQYVIDEQKRNKVYGVWITDDRE